MAPNDGARRGREAMRLSTETKQAFKTTEFWAMVVVILGILIASALIGEGDGNTGSNGDDPIDAFPAVRAWLYVATTASAYMVSRGLAKAGSRDPYWADQDDRPSGGRGGSEGRN